jgi:exosortase C (VPDSG-CTERM-specific)
VLLFKSTVTRSLISVSHSPAKLLIASGVITLAFAVPLLHLVKHALATSLHSHILLIPFISLYLWRTHRSPASPAPSVVSPVASLVSALVASLLIVLFWFDARFSFSRNDQLAILTGSYLFFLLAAALMFVGISRLRPYWFHIAFLVFMIPTPDPVLSAVGIQLQYRSADLSEPMLRLTGLPVLRDGLAFRLPGLNIFVAEECSGIRSTLVLFITSTVAAYMFLRTAWKRALIIAIILPLGILRNAFRITAISWLTVNVDPDIIHGPLHKHGGPLFFALSMVPLLLLLWYLRRSERQPSRSRVPPSVASVPGSVI